MIGTSQRFTPNGSAAIEKGLTETCHRVRAGVQRLIPASRLEGILLGGGYGRGEGGVLQTDQGERPYNDLEFYVFIAGNSLLAERAFRMPLHHLGEQLSPEAGLEVEFKVLTLSKLRRSPPAMFYYDLVMGHRWLVGDDTLLAGCEHHREANRIPLHEATRLLMNRCSGLLFALERLQRPGFTSQEADFVGRNLAKAQLAFGDVLLTAHGQYHWSCLERNRRLNTFPFEGELGWARCLVPHHNAGVDFKLHPIRSTESRDALQERHRELTQLGGKLWLWLESRRLKQRFQNAGAYAHSLTNLCPETSPWRNRLIHARTFGVSAALASESCRYPRERLFRSLATALFDRNEPPKPPDLQPIRSWLRTDAQDFPGIVAAYAKLWGRFN